MESTAERMARYRTEREELRREVRQLRRGGAGADTVSKAAVKAVAERVAKEQGWCREGLEKELRGLGIDPTPEGEKVEVRVLVNLAPGGNGTPEEKATRRITRILRGEDVGRFGLVGQPQITRVTRTA
jgi:hypothetical protein